MPFAKMMIASVLASRRYCSGRSLQPTSARAALMLCSLIRPSAASSVMPRSTRLFIAASVVIRCALVQATFAALFADASAACVAATTCRNPSATNTPASRNIFCLAAWPSARDPIKRGRVPHLFARRCGLPDDQRGDRFGAAACSILRDEQFFRAADFTEIQHRTGVGIAVKKFQRFGRRRALDRIAADADNSRLSYAGHCQPL